LTRRFATPVTLALLVVLALVSVQPAQAGFFSLCHLWGNCPPKDAPPDFVPTFEKDVMLLSPFHPPSPRNRWYFATQETADKTCELLKSDGCQKTIEQPCSSGGGGTGPNVCTAPERMLVFADIILNAGLYASIWERNPDSYSPGWPIKLARMQLKADRAVLAAEPRRFSLHGIAPVRNQ